MDQINNASGTSQAQALTLPRLCAATTASFKRRSLQAKLSPVSEVTRILDRVQQGDPKAAEELVPLVYVELRRLAAAKMAQQPAGQTLHRIRPQSRRCCSGRRRYSMAMLCRNSVGT